MPLAVALALGLVGRLLHVAGAWRAASSSSPASASAGSDSAPNAMRQQRQQRQQAQQPHAPTSRPRILRAAAIATSRRIGLQLLALGLDGRGQARARLRQLALGGGGRLGEQRLLARVRLGARNRALARAHPPRLGQRRVGARQPLLRVGLQLHGLLAVALDARDALGAHAQVRLPEELVQHEHQEQENPELDEDRVVDVNELRLVRLGSRLQ